jgi:hypothetical protein
VGFLRSISVIRNKKRLIPEQGLLMKKERNPVVIKA